MLPPLIPDDKIVAPLRREIALACDAGDCVTWVDAAAEALLGASVGARMTVYAAPGHEGRLEQLVRDSLWQRVDRRELTLLVNGAPTATAFSAVPCADGVLLVGSLIPQDDANALAQVREAIIEVAMLHKEAQRQQIERLRRSTEVRRPMDDAVVVNVSHELRTRLNAIIGLAKLLLAETDGELNAEQKKQVRFILRSSESPVELVNDLLDLSKIEAGKVALRPEKFSVGDLFAALRGMLRPLQTNPAVELSFDDSVNAGDLETDGRKISQILTNLVANALKFTEHGWVRVSAAPGPNGCVTFTVSDSGIGIPVEDQERIFEEFNQIDSPIQKRVKGTGLGLSLSRRLANGLGGALIVTSAPGAGATLTLVVPRVLPEETTRA